MAQSLEQWVVTEVSAVKEKPLRWLSEHYFFRDPSRPAFTDTTHFFAPADGILLYQQAVRPDEAIVDIKGKQYSLREAMRDPAYDRESLVIGIFMTFFDVHVNRIPFPGRLTYKQLDEIGTYNYPMLPVEHSLVRDLRLDLSEARYLHNNQRVLNRVYAPDLGQPYYILQIADYDVDSILPFQLKQNWPYAQNRRFSQVRYGSQVDLIVPLSDRFEFTPTVPTGMHVEAGVDALIRITPKRRSDTTP
ncbi:MAG TPA: phosphatidylserine decarboxylase [Gemmatimonadales bacterium]|nr:phosphatidylserine decarboxylase [Gemmatimonadales bacterium]